MTTSWFWGLLYCRCFFITCIVTQILAIFDDDCHKKHLFDYWFQRYPMFMLAVKSMTKEMYTGLYDRAC